MNSIDYCDLPNEKTISAWNGVLFDKFSRFRSVLTSGLAVHGDSAIERYCPPDARKVLDIGCGFGDTTLQIAARLGTTSQIIGVDAAERFVEAARSSAAGVRTKNCSFIAGDLETCELEGPFDFAFSRFGTMFFDRPVHALRNIRRALEPGTRLCMVVWRKREDNPAVHLAERIARSIVPEVDDPTAVTCGPGPFSMSSADVTSDLLIRAGFEDIEFLRHDAPICVGNTLDEAIEFALELGPAGELLRLAKEEGERLRPLVAAALREAFGKQHTEAGVKLGSSTWIVSAKTPRSVTVS